MLLQLSKTLLLSMGLLALLPACSSTRQTWDYFTDHDEPVWGTVYRAPQRLAKSVGFTQSGTIAGLQYFQAQMNIEKSQRAAVDAAYYANQRQKVCVRGASGMCDWQ